MRRKFLSAFAGAALVLSLTAGCQTATPEITPDQAEAFQARVLAVTSAVADGGYAAALDALTALETDLDAAAAAGSVSFARHQRIEAAITVVRADVQAAIDAQAVPEPAPAPAPAPEKSTAPVPEKTAPAPETDAEKKAREKAEDDAKKAADQKKKDAEKAAEDKRKAAEKAVEDAKKAEKDGTNTETPAPEGAPTDAPAQAEISPSNG